MNWEITNYPTNGTWSFSALSGTIPKSGSDVIEFTVTAPNEYNVDLGGPIRIVDSDDPISEETVTIIGGTMSNNSQGTGDAEVTMDGNNVSIKIGGKNQITLDNFTFSVNGIHGKISGHYVFDVTSAYVYVNWTQGNIASLSVDGDAEFTIENFAFTLGDDVNIYVSQVITGGIHWYEGKSGNFSFVVDDTFIDVDISINHSGSNFALSGNIDVDISTGTNATMWITWDLNNENKEISIDGNLLRNAQMHVLITDLKLELNNFSFGAGLILFERTVYISFEDNNLTLESESTIEIDDISIAFNGNISIIGANADIEIDGYITFSIKPWGEDGYMFCINSSSFTFDGHNLE